MTDEDKICPFCGGSNKVGGAWIERKWPLYLQDGTVYRYEDNQTEMHGICRILYERGNVMRDGKLVKYRREYNE